MRLVLLVLSFCGRREVAGYAARWSRRLPACPVVPAARLAASRCIGNSGSSGFQDLIDELLLEPADTLLPLLGRRLDRVLQMPFLEALQDRIVETREGEERVALQQLYATVIDFGEEVHNRPGSDPRSPELRANTPRGCCDRSLRVWQRCNRSSRQATRLLAGRRRPLRPLSPTPAFPARGR